MRRKPAYDLVIVGGGAAGSEAAFTVADGGRSRILLAEANHFGGTCTNHGCVPTKALVRTARLIHLIRDAGRYGIKVGAPEVEWRRAIGRAFQVRDHMLRFGSNPFKKAGVEVRFPCEARLIGEHKLLIGGTDEIEAKSVLIAAGLEPVVPPVPGLREAGYLDNEGILELKELPHRLAIVGSGPIGAEFAQIFSRFGVQVTLIEHGARILAAEEPETSAAIREVFESEGIEVRTHIKMTRVDRSDGVKRIFFESGASIEVDEILVAVGRSFDGKVLGLHTAGIEWSARGIKVNEHLRTSRPWAWAAGDVVGGPLFTHVASEMGQIAARNAMRRGTERMDLRVVPRVTFTDPEVASVGATEVAAKKGGRKVRTGFARLVDAEKAQIDGIGHGHVKCVADARTGELLGCNIVSENAGDMIHEAVAMMAARTPVKVVANAMHAYPTLSELMRSALREAGG
ncbi:MAG TPA: FAD-dependent oxidoreductase [Candidatus Dormibacteraeota bacterium]|nr:FAD-dependent oxidoreductase [Candidatus Dormibacteraeota bacterium]